MVDKKTTKKKSKKLSEIEVGPKLYGKTIFAVGLLIALIAGIIRFQDPTINQIIGATLIILGIAVGILNITKEEAVSFMVATFVIVLLLQPFMQGLFQVFALESQYVQSMITTSFTNITTFVVPATLVVALKTIFMNARDED